MSVAVGTRELGTTTDRTRTRRRWPIRPGGVYTAIALAGLFLMTLVDGAMYSGVVAVLAGGAFVMLFATGDRVVRGEIAHVQIDRKDLVAVALICALVVAFYRVAFVVIEGNDILLFLNFAAGLLIGVAGPVWYSVWLRKRSLADLGLTLNDLPQVAVFAVIFASVQFAITLWGYDLPGTRAWATLLGMAVMVGLFEAIFFRGFVQQRLEASFGTGAAVFGAAILYGAYHVGYGMGLEETVFLTGLGIIYALAYSTVRNVLVLWPLLIPVGSFFAQLESGELVGRLPWAALLGFADVVALMATVIFFAHRHERRRASESSST